ncbi:MAG TPA: metallophosphoesterase [Chthonomonadaceae bacterium]|nr:metallophosphoesterase [Chthonomonadaceae bacterium]
MTTPAPIPIDGALPDAATRRRLRFQRAIRQAAWVTAYVLLCVIGSALSVATLGRTVYRWHGFAVELRVVPSPRGQTSLVLMPLGEVHAQTHRAPVALIATLEEVQLDEINKVIHSEPKVDLLTRDLESSVRRDVRDFVLRQVAFSALGALLAPLLLRSRRPWKYVLSALLGAALAAGIVGRAFATFNGKAFESPTYTGTLRQAPWVIQFGKDAFVRIELLSQRVKTIAANLNVLYGRISVPPDRLTGGSDSDTIRILHVSDLHNNPAGLAFMQEVARQFHVSMIVDTGDLTDFGSPPEVAMVQGIGKIGYPYVFVAGNHDSRVVTDALAKLPNVTVLNGRSATLAGFTLYGLANPASQRAGVGSVDTTAEEIRAGGEAMLQAISGMKEAPDIVAIHNPEEARPLWGRVPLVLCGHLHRYYVDTEDVSGADVGPPAAPPATATLVPRFETVVCNAGTTGAAGLRYFEKEQGVPFSCAVLTFRRPRAPSKPAGPGAAGSSGPPRGGLKTPPREAAQPPGSGPAAPNSTAAGTTAAQLEHAGMREPNRPRLVAIDLIVLDGALHQYSITHRPFSELHARTDAAP